jgi:hypothetical protein
VACRIARRSRIGWPDKPETTVRFRKLQIDELPQKEGRGSPIIVALIHQYFTKA